MGQTKASIEDHHTRVDVAYGGGTSWFGLALVFEIEPFRHEVLDTPMGIPRVILLDDLPGGILAGRLDFDLVVGRQVSLAGNVGKQMRDVAEIWLLRTDVAVQRNGTRLQSRGH